MRDVTGPLPPEEQRQARAVKRAIEAAGGLEPCAQDTGKDPSLLSRCSSPNYRHSLTIRDVEIIEAIGHGRPGHPEITRHLCRAAGGVFVMLPGYHGDADGLARSTNEIAAEMGDVARAVSLALVDGVADRQERCAIRHQLDELDAASASLRMQLDAMDDAEETPPVRAQPP